MLHRLWWLGPLLLYLAACAYGLLVVHGSTDLWIGLAAGRQILTAEQFPTRDTFSYTAYGRPWYNQNWLTHVAQYLLYSRLGPNAVIFATWATGLGIFVAVLAAAYWRSRSWPGALLAAAAVAAACRDYLSPRSATVGLLCLALLWALLCALAGQGHRRRHWPIVLLLPLLLVWGNAHGSFLFGYGLLGLYVAHWLIVRTIGKRRAWVFSLVLVPALLLAAGLWYGARPFDPARPAASALVFGSAAISAENLAALVGILLTYFGYWAAVRRLRPAPALSGRQGAALVGVVVAAFVLTVLLGPFGIDNFLHPRKIAGSQVFRLVTEWRPAYRFGSDFPPVWRFWLVFGTGVVLATATALVARLRGRSADQAETVRPASSPLDLVIVALGLALTIWARRFAPLCLILAGPIAVCWIARQLDRLRPAARPPARRVVMAAAGLGGLVLGYHSATTAYTELVTQFADHPDYNLLQRTVRYDLTPHDAIVFLRNNELHVNLLVEWSQAGVVMLEAPTARVFIDGRAQQVYDESHYAQYHLLLVAPDTPHPLLLRLLDRSQTDAVLLRRWERPKNLGLALEQSSAWIPVLLDSDYTLFLRRGSRGLAELGERLRRGEEWRPNTPAALATRGLVWEALEPPNLLNALDCWRRAVRQNPTVGRLCFPHMTRVLLALGRGQEAERLISDYEQLLEQPFTGLPPRVRQDLLATLAGCRQMLADAGAAEP